MIGHFLKMQTKLSEPVKYTLHFDEHIIEMNEQIGKRMQIQNTGEIHCIHCGRKTKTSFSQGYCYPCFTSLPQTDPGVISPEKNMAHKGISRDMEWSKKYDLIDHIVYLALSGGLKVGVTRHTQIPTRWIDQGAHSAVRLAITPYRNLAGQIEVFLKQFINDKTNWRAMLTNKTDGDPELLDARNMVIKKLPNEFKQYIADNDEIIKINYPVDIYPPKVKSVNLEKEPLFESTLRGIRGQYLIFDNGNVINVRKYSGYKMEINFK